MNFSRYRRVAPIFAIIAFSNQIFAQNPRQAAVDAVAIVKSVAIKPMSPRAPGSVSIAVQVQNLTKRTIYGLKLTGFVAWSDGSTKNVSVGPIDLVPLYVNVDLAPLGGPLPPTFTKPSILRGGETYTVDARAATRNGISPTSATYTISMVAFEDQTAIGPHIDVQELMDLRVRGVANYQGNLADFQMVAGADDPVVAAVRRAKEIRAPQLAEDHLVDGGGKRISPNESRAAWLTSIVNSTPGGNENKRAVVVQYVPYYQKLIEITKLHSALREVAK